MSRHWPRAGLFYNWTGWLSRSVPGPHITFVPWKWPERVLISIQKSRTWARPAHLLPSHRWPAKLITMFDSLICIMEISTIELAWLDGHTDDCHSRWGWADLRYFFTQPLKAPLVNTRLHIGSKISICLQMECWSIVFAVSICKSNWMWVEIFLICKFYGDEALKAKDMRIIIDPIQNPFNRFL